jgi:regulation of enolase protein 1 (concanavalin A-like superfamily)
MRQKVEINDTFHELYEYVGVMVYGGMQNYMALGVDTERSRAKSVLGKLIPIYACACYCT